MPGAAGTTAPPPGGGVLLLERDRELGTLEGLIGAAVGGYPPWRWSRGRRASARAAAVRARLTKATIVALINGDVEHEGLAPSTRVGEAITKVISRSHVYTLPAAPPTQD